ncbi:MAG: hypothetical protein EPN20_04585 [Magnetospirillum sp.]|nr:MAG: hypothetical protein EPN20_04585 [Magnetospirillum sp.]
MSDPLRVALVVEGPTDHIVIDAAMRAMLGNRRFILTPLQPEGSLAFGPLGGGWGGVYRWCVQQARDGGGRLSLNRMLDRFDLLIVHVDADVADDTYAAANITPRPADLPLPCARPCPPAAESTNPLRAVVLSWCGEPAPPERILFCVPSKSMEAWVVASLFPNDAAVMSRTVPFECYPTPESRLGQQPKNVRFAKRQPDYRARSLHLRTEWPRIAAPGGLEEANRFRLEFLAAV